MVTENELDTPLIGDGDSALLSPNGIGGDAVATEPPKGGAESTTAPPEAGAESKTDEQEVDYKTKFEAAEQELVKVNLDRKAENTGRQRAADRDAARDAKMDEILDGQKAAMDSNAVLIKALNSGETEGVSSELDTITQDSRSRTSMSRLTLQARGLLNALTDIGKDADGNTVVDIQQDERFAEVRGEWNKISGDANLEPSDKIAQLSRVVTQANVTMRGIDRELNKKALDEARDAGDDARKKALEEANVLDTDTGGRTGSAELSESRYLEQVAAGTVKNDYKRTQTILDDLPKQPGGFAI